MKNQPITRITAEDLRLHALWVSGRKDGRRLRLAHYETISIDPDALPALHENPGLYRANLQYAYLSGLDLSRVNLGKANLTGANLQRVNLSHSSLTEANLSYANLADANLSYAELVDTKLTSAQLSYANLDHATLIRIDAPGLDMHDANLSYAEFYDCDLSSADLNDTNLHDARIHNLRLLGASLDRTIWTNVIARGVDLRYAELRGVVDLPATIAAELIVAPPEGEIIGWKKLHGGLIAKLRIPASALRSNASGRKCRASEAEVLSIYDPQLHAYVQHGTSWYNSDFPYTVGETVRPEIAFDPDRWAECSSGIHFFLTREEAEAF